MAVRDSVTISSKWLKPVLMDVTWQYQSHTISAHLVFTADKVTKTTNFSSLAQQRFGLLRMTAMIFRQVALKPHSLSSRLLINSTTKHKPTATAAAATTTTATTTTANATTKTVVTCKIKHLQNVLQPSTSRGSKTFLQMFHKCFILHVTTFYQLSLACVQHAKNVLQHFCKCFSIKHLRNIFSRAVERLIFFNRVNRAINYFNRALMR